MSELKPTEKQRIEALESLCAQYYDELRRTLAEIHSIKARLAHVVEHLPERVKP